MTCPACGDDGRQDRLGRLWNWPRTLYRCHACDQFYVDGASSDVVPPLSEAERQLLSLVAAGHVNKHIARELAISLRSVHIHRKLLMAKLGARNKFELVVKAAELGLLQRPIH